MQPMNSPIPSQKLPMWIFFATDALLLGTAWFIAESSPQPLPASSVLGVVLCVVAGAVVGLLPLIARFERQKNELLDQRQQALESLARTVATSAEQISIAAGGLNGIAEVAQKNLRHAEQLPHKLQEKMAEFQAQLASAGDDEKEELERELAALRASESERLDTISDRISKSTAEWSRLEAATQRHLTAASEALAKLDQATAGITTKAIEEAKSAALAAIESDLKRTAVARAATNLGRSGDETPATSDAELEPPPIASTAITEVSPVAPASTSPFAAGAANPHSAPAAAEPAAQPAKQAPSAGPSPEENPAAETAPTPKTRRREPVRKRAARKPPSDRGPAIDSDIDESGPDAGDAEVTQPGVVERVRTSDGATRLIATAYIGIGNRLFIRGDGPGLSWDKGVPLQFVSIGKWRWETDDATGPVSFKLYKNDELECAALGTQQLDPGNQQEVVATF